MKLKIWIIAVLVPTFLVMPTFGQAVTKIAAGYHYSLFLKSDGRLWGMGQNNYGQLGDGTFNNTNRPEQIVAGGVTAIATRNDYSLFLKSDGSLWGMGQNNYGQLGDGTFNNTNRPEQIVAGGVTAIAVGDSHSLFLKSDGSLWGMGDNYSGALGDGTFYNNTNRPKQIVAGGVTAVAAGYDYSLFLKSDGSLWGMGIGGDGVLGDGAHVYAINKPEQIVAGGVTAIAAGEDVSLFLKSDGSLWAMGGNNWGQLGDGTLNSAVWPEQIVAGGVTAIAAGYLYSLFLKSDGSLWGMGINDYGQLGDGTFNNTNRPEQIVAGGVTAIAAGNTEYSLFLKSDGSLWGMGQNGYGQLGDGTFNNTNRPEQIVLPVQSAPLIITQPQNQTAPVGSNVVFSVVAGGWPSPNYQWQFNGQNLGGQTAASLSLTNVQFANAGGYLVIVTNTYGSVTSAVAQLTVFTNLVVAQTNKAPPLPGSPTIPTDATHFKVFTNGGFVTGIGLNPSKSTVVITHGWNDSSTIWPLEIANDIKLMLGASAPNIVAWDWTAEAHDMLTAATYKTLGQGYALGTNLVAALGTNYSMRLHFMGHSLGTLVNAVAANYVHGHRFSPANTQMTLFDEASAASGLLVDSWQTATTLLQNDANPQLTLQPVLPDHFAWADNYITAFGLLHSNAVNVILTNEYPVIDNSVFGDIFNTAEAVAYMAHQVWPGFIDDDTIYHHYPHYWYFNTINQINNPNDPPYLMGFVRSWEGGGYASRPSTNTYYIESANCPPSFPSYSGYDPAYNLVKINSGQASQFLNNRLKTILPQHLVSAISASQNVTANDPNRVRAMLASGEILNPTADVELLLQNGLAAFVQFNTTLLAHSLVVKGAAQPQGGPVPNGTGINSPAYVWLTLSVPSNSVAMSFDFMLQGNGNQDSFQAALNNQNIFTLETVLIQTNVGMNSGMIDVSQYAGQQVQLFLGIVGGTSTNATATVGNILFYSAAPPTLQIQLAGTNVVLSWPLWAASYSLEITATLGRTNSWTVVTNAAWVVNSQCTVTNQISGKSSYYRLAIIAAPALQAQVSGKNFILSWPASASGYVLETTTNLAATNSWVAVTNTPALLNQQSVVTNQISGAARFYRLSQ
jgi:alpha-tubulin suppressor-like RCC1 family protein/pimeloyl-ACP methyl ester carboxylesterase